MTNKKARAKAKTNAAQRTQPAAGQQTVFYLSRCDGAAAYFLSCLQRRPDGSGAYALLCFGLGRGILNGNHMLLPPGNPFSASPHAFKAFLEQSAVVADHNEDGGGAQTVREIHRAIEGGLAAAIARTAEAETDRRKLRGMPEVVRGLNLLREGGAQHAEADVQLLQDPLMGSSQAMEAKQLIARLLPVFRDTRPRVMQVGSGLELAGEGWYGAVYDLLHFRGEYRYCFSFVEEIVGLWKPAWVTPGASPSQVLETGLLGLAEDPAAEYTRRKCGLMMRHMARWHAIGGEHGVSALALLAAEDAERKWEESAIAVALMASTPVQRLFALPFSFEQIGIELHNRHNQVFQVLTGPVDRLREMTERFAPDGANNPNRGVAAADSDDTDDDERVVITEDGSAFRLGNGWSEEEIRSMQEEMAGLNLGGAASGGPALASSASQPRFTTHIFEMDGLAPAVTALDMDPAQVLHFSTHVSNRRMKSDDEAGSTWSSASVARIAVEAASPLESEQLFALVNGPEVPPKARLQLADMLMWGMKGVERCSENEKSAVQLYTRAATEQGDPEAMMCLAEWHTKQLAKAAGTFDAERGHAGLPPLNPETRNGAGGESFVALIKWLGRAAQAGWVTSMTLDMAFKTYDDPRILHGLEGGVAVTAAGDARHREMLGEARERVRRREARLRERAANGLAEGETLKAEGNAHFGERRFMEAARCYTEAIEVVEAVREERAAAFLADEQRFLQLLVRALANRAQCRLNTDNFHGALADVQEARAAGWTTMPADLLDKLAQREDKAKIGLAAQRRRDRKRAQRRRRREEQGVVEAGMGARGAADGRSAEVEGESGEGEAGTVLGRSRSQAAGKAGEGSAGNAEEEEEEGGCPVCLLPASARKPYTQMPRCRHEMHARCLAVWRMECVSNSREPTCPICRTPF